MADKAFDDNDQSVYKTHILYVAAKDANCVKLLSKLESMPLFDEVFVQDIAQLRQRPAWLDGVPILVCKKTNQAHKGQNIYTYAQAYQPDEFVPAGAVTGGWSSFEDGENYGSFDRKFSSLFNSATYDLEEDGPARGGVGAPVAAPTSGTSGASGGGMNEKQMRRQQSEQEAQERAQEMVSVRQRQDQMVQSRNKPTTPLSRTAFSDEDGPALRHPPPNPMAAQQRAPEVRQPAYGRPQHYTPPPPQQAQQHVQAQYLPPQQAQYAAAQYAQPEQYAALQTQYAHQYYGQVQGQPQYQQVQPQAQYYQPPQYYQQQPHVQAQPQYYNQPAYGYY